MPHEGAPTPDLTTQEQERLRRALDVRPRGLLTDIDGTISAIAPTPDEAVLYPGILPLLMRATGVFDLVVAISGRSALDARRLVGLPSLTYVGNHGLERLPPGGPDDQVQSSVQVLPAAKRYIPVIKRVMDQAAAELDRQVPGAMVERKGATGSIHVRNTHDPTTAQRAVVALLERLTKGNTLRITQGKMVVELRPPLATNKGTIVAELVRSHRLRGAFYLGDDTTDIDAFRALRQLTAEGVCRGVAVAVMHPEAPAGLASEADVVLPSIAAVPPLLEWMLGHA